MTTQATRLLDAQTVLVGWINHSATDCYEHSRSSGDFINLGTDLDASCSFVLVASHPGHSDAVTVTLELAPLLADGTAGSSSDPLRCSDSQRCPLGFGCQFLPSPCGDWVLGISQPLPLNTTCLLEGSVLEVTLHRCGGPGGHAGDKEILVLSPDRALQL